MSDPREALVELLARAEAASNDYPVWDELRESTKQIYRAGASNYLDALCAAPPELLWPVIMPWQGMETLAVSDGIEVLLFDAGGRIWTATWCHVSAEWVEAWDGETIEKPRGWLPLPPPGDAP